MNKLIVVESAIASLGIMLIGFLTIPFAASLVGEHISMESGAGMSVLFAIGRFGYLMVVRCIFEKVRDGH